MRNVTVAVVLAATILCGCSHEVNGFRATPRSEGDVLEVDSAKRQQEAVVNALKQRVLELHLKYEIYCFRDSGCNAEAWPCGMTYLESTLHPKWQAHAGDPTAAAVSLIQILNGEPNFVPQPGTINPPNPPTYDSGIICPKPPRKKS